MRVNLLVILLLLTGSLVSLEEAASISQNYWARSYGKDNYHDGITGVAVALNENIIVAADNFLMSLKPDGSINWVKDIPADSLALAPNGDIVIISAHGLPLVARLDSQGNLKWAIEFHGNPPLGIMGTGVDNFKAFAIAPNGDIIAPSFFRIFISDLNSMTTQLS